MWHKLVLITALSLTAASCGLLPSFKETMSSEEKASINLQMGLRYLDMGMLEIAKEKLETALKLDSSNAEVHNALAVFSERIRDYEAANDHYDSAIDKAPDNFSFKNNYGRFLCEQGKYEKGMKLLQQSLDLPLNNRTWFALTNMGLCHLKQNNSQLAEDYFRQALQVQPEYSPALLQMQRISYDKRQFMSARAFMERYLNVAKHTAETLYIAYQTERALGNAESAEDYKQQLLSAFPVSKEAQQLKSIP